MVGGNVVGHEVQQQLHSALGQLLAAQRPILPVPPRCGSTTYCRMQYGDPTLSDVLKVRKRSPEILQQARHFGWRWRFRRDFAPKPPSATRHRNRKRQSHPTLREAPSSSRSSLPDLRASSASQTQVLISYTVGYRGQLAIESSFLHWMNLLQRAVLGSSFAKASSASCRRGKIRFAPITSVM